MPHDTDAISPGVQYAEFEQSRLSEYESRIRSWPIDVRGSRILDLGAGPGQWGLLLMQMGAASLTWHDNSAEFEQSARTLHARHGIFAAYVRADLMDLARYEDKMFDLVIARLAIYFAGNEWRLLDDIGRIADKWIYIEAPTWQWSYRRYGINWKLPLRLATPLAALLTRRKLLPTNWTPRWFSYWRLRQHGFFAMWEQYGPARQSWRTLFERRPTG